MPSTNDISSLLCTLSQRGWAHHFSDSLDVETMVKQLEQIGNLLGPRAAGRNQAREELIQPQDVCDSHPRSLSARFGLKALPLHTELSHRPIPCRYLLLGCINTGTSDVKTVLLDWRTLSFSSDELSALESAPLLIRNGRRSFYGTILPPDHKYLRYDPCCLEAVDERGKWALKVVETQLAKGFAHNHLWKQGQILIIDNWRMLHGRGASSNSTGRQLARILIDA